MIPTSSAWYEAEVTGVTTETPCAKTFTFRLPHPATHLPGQHYELRLTAPDGYQAARLYSAASAGRGEPMVQLTIANMQDGEVSPYLHTQIQSGSRLEMRGPLGRSFVWDPTDTAPVLLVAGGIGVTPMRAILQAYTDASSRTPMHLVYSARSSDEIVYRSELLGNPMVTIALTRDWPADWQGETGRIGEALLRRLVGGMPQQLMCYVCGMNGFVEAANSALLGLGITPAHIRAERFGS